jgi:hypothetical protein
MMTYLRLFTSSRAVFFVKSTHLRINGPILHESIKIIRQSVASRPHEPNGHVASSLQLPYILHLNISLHSIYIKSCTTEHSMAFAYVQQIHSAPSMYTEMHVKIKLGHIKRDNLLETKKGHQHHDAFHLQLFIYFYTVLILIIIAALL